MIRRENAMGRIWGLLILAVILVISCKKDKVPPPEPLPEPTKWEVIQGNYKVYDTLSNFLYDMNIVYVPNESVQYTDSLRFENFDGEFTFTQFQSSGSNFPQNYILIGYHDNLYDTNLNRWKILHTYDSLYNNALKNDTIRMKFGKTNINYYIEDLTPYYSCGCKQIAVKQN